MPKSRFSGVYQNAVAEVDRKWGRSSRDRLGDDLWEALVCREILINACAQDDSISADIIVAVINKARDEQLADLYDLQGGR